MYSIINKYKLLALHLMVLVLGFTGILGKLITLESTHLVWYRMLIAFILLFIFLLITNRIKQINPKNILPLIGAGFVVALHWLFFFESIKVSNVSIAVICLSTSSLFSAFLEPIFFKRKILKYEVFFGLIVMITLAFMLYEKPENKYLSENYTLGYFYGFISSFLATLFTIINAKFINKIDATEITMIEMLGGVILISLYFFIINDCSIASKTISISDLSYLFILGSICTAGVFVWMIEIMRYMTPYSVIMAVNLEPIYSIIIALIIFNDSEAMNTFFYFGGTLILLTVFFDGYIKAKKKSFKK